MRVIFRIAGLALVAVAVLATLSTLAKPPLVVPPFSPAPPPAPRTAPVFYGRSSDLEVLLHRRFAEPERAAFADAALLCALVGRPPEELRVSPPVFVELWVVRRAGDALLPLPGSPPRASLRDGRRVLLRTLAELAATPPPPAAEPLLAAFGGEADAPLGNHRLRRIVYALPTGTAFEDVVQIDAAGEALRSALALVESMEAWPEGLTRPMNVFLTSDDHGRLAEAAGSNLSAESR